MRRMLTAARAVMLPWVLGALLPIHVRAQRAASSPQGQSGCRAAALPELRMSMSMIAPITVAPVWAPSADGACSLSHLEVVRLIGMPESGVLLDSADQAAYAATVLSRVEETTEFTVLRGADTVRYTFSSDSLQFDYDYGRRSRLGPDIVARAEIHDASLLSALLTGSSVTVLTRSPFATDVSARLFWPPTARRWMDRLQSANREIASATRSD